MKEVVARELAKRIQPGETIGIGSGSTAELAILEIGKRIRKEGLCVSGVATSLRSASLAAEEGITVLFGTGNTAIDWAFDGADEVDPELNMIKGRGAAMLSEKIIAERVGGLVVLITAEKLVSQLGEIHPVPIEIIPSARSLVEKALSKLSCNECRVRQSSSKYGPVVTEHGNIVLDARFPQITQELERSIKGITGVVESGLFYNLAKEVLIAREDGIFSRKPGQAQEEKLA